MSSKEAVRRILEREGNAMRFMDIVKRAREQGLNQGQTSGALKQLKQDGTIENFEWGNWRIVSAPESRQKRNKPPNVAGLTGKEAVFKILEHIRKPARKKDIEKWLKANEQEPLTDGQINGAFYALSTNYLNVVERVERGIYCLHKEWNGEPLEMQESVETGSPIRVPNEPRAASKDVIPCFGLHWERDLVSWSKGQNLLGAHNDGDAVNFADQTGVYVLYQWPQVNYVGRTVRGSLFQRLKSHDDEDSERGHWDKFSWFGLSKVDGNGRLHERDQMSITDEVVMMEALLISVLTPPYNKRWGEGMGKQYSQVPDPMVEERKQKALAKTLSQLLHKDL